ncbi:MAG TPA: glycoside hydrolase family 2, partial [bacterium]|nr:glycoside hydrolase family 2 [bacterium]
MIFKRVPIQLLALPVFLLFALSSYAAEIPRPEHPRPDFRRDAWLNLNGAWNFAFDPENAGETNGWFQPDYADWPKTITVPYPWESRLSGIADTNYKGTAWYQRRFTLPAEWNGKQILLHFGAVDWYAKVWVDGTLVGEHDGGY